MRSTPVPDYRALLVEKEVIESQVRKLQVENSSLHTENKLLKDKLNRAQSKVSTLEQHVMELQRSADDAQESSSKELMAIHRQHRMSMADPAHEDLRRKVLDLTRDLEILKAENASLENQLTTSRKTADYIRTSPEKSKMFEAHRMEVSALKGELKKVKSLLSESEESRGREVERRKETAQQLVKVTEMKNLLQQQLESGTNSSTAEKQVHALERRLKITEERLQQERADRAGKVSQTEDKLLTENTKFQVSDKELRRQLQREKDRVSNLEQKMRDMKKSMDNNINSIDIHRQNNDRVSPRGLRPTGRWNSDGTEVTKVLSEEHAHMEEQLFRLQETINDIKTEKLEMEDALRKDIKQLIEDRHMAQVRVHHLEDLMAGIKAENNSLKSSLANSSFSGSGSKTGDIKSYEAQLQSLQSELSSVQGQLAAEQRGNALLETEVETMHAQVRAKERALEEAMEDARRASLDTSNHEDSDRKQKKIDQLNGQLQGLRLEVKMLQDKLQQSEMEQVQLEEQCEALTKKLTLTSTRAESGGKAALQSLESAREELESELHDKAIQLARMSAHFQESEDNLQRTKQSLIYEQECNADVSAQVESQQVELRQKNRALDRITSQDHDKHTEIVSLRENLAAANQDLTHKSQENKRLLLEVDQERERATEIRRVLAKRESQLDEHRQEIMSEATRATSLLSDNKHAREHLVDLERQVKTLEYERDSYKHDVQKSVIAVDGVVKENSELLNQIRELRQDLIQDKASLKQILTTRADIEQKLEICKEERGSYLAEKKRLEVDYLRLQENMQHTIVKLELEAKQAVVDMEKKYVNLTLDGKKLGAELEMVRRVNTGKGKEIELLHDTIGRQKQEIDSLHRKVDLLKEENAMNRSDIERLTNELTAKMKENAASLEVNQYLCNEKTKLQMDKYQLQKDITKEKEEIQKRATEIQELQKKVTREEENVRKTEKKLHQKETQLVAQETELKHLNRSLAQLEIEKRDTKSTVERLNEDVRNVDNINKTLEQRLTMEKSSLSETKSTTSHLKEDLDRALMQLEVTKQEYHVASSTLEAERKTVEMIKDRLQTEEEKNFQLEDRLRMLTQELDSLKIHLASSKDNAEQYKRDKQALYSDLQDMVKTAGDKDNTIARLQAKCNETVEKIQKEYYEEKITIHRDRDTVEQELLRAKEEIDDLTEQLNQKKVQLEAFGKTLRELEEETRSRLELQSRVQMLESEAQDNRVVMGSLRTESVALSEQNKKLQDKLEKEKQNVQTLREQLDGDKSSLSQQILDLKQTMAEDGTRHEIQKSELRDQLNRSLANVKAMEQTLVAVTDTKDHLYTTNKSIEKAMDTLKSQLHEEVTARKLAEQRIESMKSQIDELRKKKLQAEQRYSDLQMQLAKAEAELSNERDQVKQMKEDYNQMEALSNTHEARSVALQDQISHIEGELSTVRKQYETQKVHLTGKSRKTSMELKQQTEVFEKERTKLMLQAQQLAVDLEQVREQVAIKNRDNLRLHEEILNIEERMREAQARAKEGQEGAKLEKEMHEKLLLKYQDMEREVKKLEKMKNRKDGDDVDGSSEMNKTLSNLTRQMHSHFESQKSSEQYSRDKTEKQLEEAKKRCVELESRLSGEEAMHIVTRTQLQASEDDCQRLRFQLQTLRRRDSPNTSDKRRNRMEEINEIIARSQARAQTMLATGMYEDPLKTMKPSRDFMASTMPSMSAAAAHSFGNQSPGMDGLGSMNGSYLNGTIGGATMFSPNPQLTSTMPLSSAFAPVTQTNTTKYE